MELLRPIRWLALLLVAPIASGCGSDDAGAGGAGGSQVEALAACEALTGGALVTLEIVDERLVVYSTDRAFVEEAKRLLLQDEQRVAVFADLVEGTLCDPGWSWHPAPEPMGWGDVPMAICDGTPSLIEADPAYWIEMLDRFCPQEVRVLRVEER